MITALYHPPGKGTLVQRGNLWTSGGERFLTGSAPWVDKLGASRKLLKAVIERSGSYSRTRQGWEMGNEAFCSSRAGDISPGEQSL